MKSTSAATTLLCLAGLAATSVAATFQGLGDLPGGAVSSTATAISKDGTVAVGYSRSANGTHEAFRWNADEGIVGLGDLSGGAFYSVANGVNADGSVIVGGSLVAGDIDNPFVWDSVNGMVPVAVPVGYSQAFLYGVNDDGSVLVGLSRSPSIASEATRWDAGVGVGLGQLPGGSSPFGMSYGVSGDGEVVVGQSLSSDGPQGEAFRWDAVNGMTGLNNGLERYSAAHASNADGSVIVGLADFVVGWPNPSLQTHAMRWTEADGMHSLGVLLFETGSTATDVNDDGTVIVGQSGSKAFIWREGTGIQRLSTVLTSEYGLDLTGWNLTSAVGVSADGLVIVGNGTNPDGQSEGWIVDLRAPAPTCAGDVSGDGFTNAADFTILAGNFGSAVTPNTSGDLNGDGLVNSADFTILAGDFGCGANRSCERTANTIAHSSDVIP
jgi:probable HAF family extracellular repeat protein